MTGLHQARRRGGFTMVELMVAAVILILGLSLGVRGLVYFMNESREAEAQDRLDIDVQTSMEKIKYDLRLSTLDKIYYSPLGGPSYKAISFPTARDDDGDGALEVDAEGKIIWDRTMIYHVWEGDPNRLLLTVFDPRDNALTDAQRQLQIDAVLTDGNGAAAPNGSSANTYVVFENLFEWNLRPVASIYDAYAPAMERDPQAFLGATLLTPGNHTFRFQTTGRHASSTGYRIGLDVVTCSSSHSPREAEWQFPMIAQSGASAVAQYMAGGSWSGNYQLYFPATAIGQYFEFQMYNDEWVEENFSATGETHERTLVKFDTGLSPNEYMVQLRGMDYNWEATRQSLDSTGASGTSGELSKQAVRVLVRGSQMLDGGAIRFQGGKSCFNFRSGSAGSLKIKSAYIGECAGTTNISMDMVAGSIRQITFSGGAEATIPTASSRWSDWITVGVKPEKSYLVSYRIEDSSSDACPWQWPQAAGMTGSYMVAVTAGIPASVVSDAIWNTRTDVTTKDSIYALQAIYTAYPSNGVYASTIYDTQMSAPQFSSLDWRAQSAYGTALRMKIRAGNQPDLSDAPGWTNVAFTATKGTYSGGTGRYVQFQATLDSDSSRFYTPKLQAVSVRWPGESKIVGLGGIITKGPDYGTFQSSVDGQQLKNGIMLDLQIFNSVRIHGQVKKLTSALTAEVVPRNTGH